METAVRWIAIGMTLTSAWLVSCGATRGAERAAAPPPPPFAGAPSLDGELVVRPDALERPALELRFPVPNPASTLGWGVVHLWAHPRQDEIRVTGLFDAPAAVSRWSGCRRVSLRMDAHEQPVAARYVGRPMGGSLGVYDAVRLSLDILTLRRIARARVVRGDACGDPFELSPAQLDSVRRFVELFDALAAPRHRREVPFYRAVGPRVERLPLEEGSAEPLEG